MKTSSNSPWWMLHSASTKWTWELCPQLGYNSVKIFCAYHNGPFWFQLPFSPRIWQRSSRIDFSSRSFYEQKLVLRLVSRDGRQAVRMHTQPIATCYGLFQTLRAFQGRNRIIFDGFWGNITPCWLHHLSYYFKTAAKLFGIMPKPLVNII